MDPATLAVCCSIFAGLYKGPPPPPEPAPDRFVECVSTIHPVEGVPHGYLSMVTCPGEHDQMCVQKCKFDNRHCVTQCR
jgi:hypothetical protein